MKSWASLGTPRLDAEIAAVNLTVASTSSLDMRRLKFVSLRLLSPGQVLSITSGPEAQIGGGTAPVAGDDLVFPAGASRFTTANNFVNGTNFGSITIESNNYELIGNSILLTNGISATYSTGTSVNDLDTLLGGGTISVNSGALLQLGGALSGSARPAIPTPGPRRSRTANSPSMRRVVRSVSQATW